MDWKSQTRSSLAGILATLMLISAPVNAEPEPPVLAGAQVAWTPIEPREGGWDDLYGKWEATPEWHIGLRMDDAEIINANTDPGGFQFDGLPYHEIDQELGATVFHMRQGEQALPLGAQIRPEFAKLDPSNAKVVTIVWEAKYDPAFYTGGKAYQLSEQSGGDKRRVEHNALQQKNPDPGLNYILVPATRTYVASRVGGNGTADLLSSEDWPQRNIQPALWAPGRNYTYSYERDHVTGTNTGTYAGKTVRAFLIRPGQWYRYIYTLDWRSKPHRIFLWMESEDTPRTLLLADESDPNEGFILEFDDNYTGVEQFWFEFNNSRTTNDVDFDVAVRNFFVIRDVLGKDL